MSRKKDPNKKPKYRNYSFRCTIGEHDGLIRLLDTQPDNRRSDAIRDLLVAAAKLPKRTQPKPLDLEILRRELASVVDEILNNIPAGLPTVSGEALQVIPHQRRDVNDMGDRIPDF